MGLLQTAKVQVQHLGSLFMAVKRDLTALSDEVWRRLVARLDGLLDDEYFWEPAPGCWTLRDRGDGGWRTDWPLPRPHPEPFTTIAWRLWHVIDMYGENRAPNWLDVPPQGDPIGHLIGEIADDLVVAAAYFEPLVTGAIDLKAAGRLGADRQDEVEA